MIRFTGTKINFTAILLLLLQSLLPLATSANASASSVAAWLTSTPEQQGTRSMEAIWIFAHVADAPLHISIKDFDRAHFGPGLSASTLLIKDVSMVSNRKIVLKNNTIAYRSDFEFMHDIWPMHRVVVVTKKQNKWIWVSATVWNGRSLNNGIKIVESLTVH